MQSRSGAHQPPIDALPFAACLMAIDRDSGALNSAAVKLVPAGVVQPFDFRRARARAGWIDACMHFDRPRPPVHHALHSDSARSPRILAAADESEGGGGALSRALKRWLRILRLPCLATMAQVG